MRPVLIFAAATAAGIGGAEAGEPPLGVIAGVSGGVLAHGVELISRTGNEGGPAFNGEVDLAPALHPFGGVLYPEIGGSVATGGATSYGYADLKYEMAVGSNWFLGAGLGGAVHNGELKATSPNRNALGSRFLFHLPFEAGYAVNANWRVSLYYEHISNGYLASPNEGLDNAGMRLGYRF